MEGKKPSRANLRRCGQDSTSLSPPQNRVLRIFPGSCCCQNPRPVGTTKCPTLFNVFNVLPPPEARKGHKDWPRGIVPVGRLAQERPCRAPGEQVFPDQKERPRPAAPRSVFLPSLTQSGRAQVGGPSGGRQDSAGWNGPVPARLAAAASTLLTRYQRD